MLSRSNKFKSDRAVALRKHDRSAIFYHCCRMKLTGRSPCTDPFSQIRKID